MTRTKFPLTYAFLAWHGACDARDLNRDPKMCRPLAECEAHSFAALAALCLARVMVGIPGVYA